MYLYKTVPFSIEMGAIFDLALRAIANKMNSLGIKSPRGGKWYLPTVQRVQRRIQIET